MNKKIYFYNKKKGYPKSALNFYIQMSKNECMLHIKSKNKLCFQNLTEMYNILSSFILDWSDDLKFKIINSIKLLFKELLILDNNLFNHIFWYYKTTFILVKDELEFGFPHTNSQFIFFPISYILDTNNIKLAQTIFHEMIHIFQRFCQNQYLLDHLSKKFDFHKLNLENLKIPFLSNSLSNPDTFQVPSYIYHDIQNNKYFYFVLILENKKLKRKSFEFNLIKNEFLENKKEYIPIKYSRNQYEHPYELMACVFSENLFKNFL